jgi:hypothetical protein
MLFCACTSRGRDENSNGLCSCGLPRSEALRVASTLATARGCDFLKRSLSGIQEVQTRQLHSADPCQDIHPMLSCTCSDRVVLTTSLNEPSMSSHACISYWVYILNMSENSSTLNICFRIVLVGVNRCSWLCPLLLLENLLIETNPYRN